MTTLRSALVAATLVAAVAAGCGTDANDATTALTDASDSTPSSDDPVVLLDAVGETVLGQPIVYPDGDVEITSTLITLQPGQETGWHRHDTPLYGHILDGTLTVDYGEDGERVYETGDSLIEAIGTSHNGRATGDEPVRILVVNIGSDAAENTVMDES